MRASAINNHLIFFANWRGPGRTLCNIEETSSAGDVENCLNFQRYGNRNVLGRMPRGDGGVVCPDITKTINR